MQIQENSSVLLRRLWALSDLSGEFASGSVTTYNTVVFVFAFPYIFCVEPTSRVSAQFLFTEKEKPLLYLSGRQAGRNSEIGLSHCTVRHIEIKKFSTNCGTKCQYVESFLYAVGCNKNTEWFLSHHAVGRYIFLSLYKSFLRRFFSKKRHILYAKFRRNPPARVSPLLRLRRKIHLFLRFMKHRVFRCCGSD